MNNLDEEILKKLNENSIIIFNKLTNQKDIDLVYSIAEKTKCKLLPVLKHCNTMGAMKLLPPLNKDELLELIKNVKCLYIMGENPAMCNGDVLKSLDFLITQSIIMNETCNLSNVVLPASCWAEKDGTFTNSERRVQRIRKAVNPPEEALDDWIIIKKLAEKMGYGDMFNYTSPEEIFNEIRKATPQYAGITYERLGVEGIHWPCKTEDSKGTPILHTEKFLTLDGLGKLFAVEYGEAAELPDEEYPMILTTGRLIFHYHTGTMTRKCKHITSEINEGFVEIHPEDAKKLNIKDKELVRVSSRRGEVKVKAKITENIKKGVVFMPFHFAECAANILTNTALDPNCKIPEFKVCAVRIDKI